MHYIKPNLQIYDFHDFIYYSSIVTASFNKITVFYRDRIIENDRKYILMVTNILLKFYLMFKQSLFMKIFMIFRVRYIIIAETISNYFYKNS